MNRRNFIKGSAVLGGALVAERRVRCVIFFWDPLTPQPHDVDVKALLRLTVLHNIPTACNRVTADFLISSPLFSETLRGSGVNQMQIEEFRAEHALINV